MLVFNSIEIIFTWLFFGLCSGLWALYYFCNSYITSPRPLATDKKTKKRLKTLFDFSTATYPVVLFVIVLFNYMYTTKFNASLKFWLNINFFNNSLWYFEALTSLMLVIWFLGVVLKKQNLTISFEYIIFIVLSSLIAFFLSSSVNLLTTIFCIELVGLLVFGKFVVINGLKKKNINNQSTTNTLFVKQNSFGLFNALFFQFWANFISSVILIFVLLILHNLYGCSNFFLLNWLCFINSDYNYIGVSNLFFTFSLLITGIFIKLGVAPYQFFKIETYKSIPLYVLVVYTSLYFFIYIYFFINLFLINFPAIKIQGFFFFFFSVFVGVFYLISLLFDTSNFKAFLSYSSIITVINLLIVVLNA